MAQSPPTHVSTRDSDDRRSSSLLVFLIGALFGGIAGALIGAVVGHFSASAGTSLLEGFRRLFDRSSKDRPRFELLLQ